jgi:hypothetical protein
MPLNTRVDGVDLTNLPVTEKVLEFERRSAKRMMTSKAPKRSRFAYSIGQDGKSTSKPLRKTTSLASRAVTVIAADVLDALLPSPL